VVALILITLLVGLDLVSAHAAGYTMNFMLRRCRGFSSTGHNPFLILKPGYKLVLEGVEDGVEKRLVVAVSNDTRRINVPGLGDIETRVVVETEREDGEVVEVSRNYFAICNRTNSVIYFGEDVDIYEDGEIVGHEGEWLAGVNGARPGIIMPGTVLLGARYFQEIARGVALDRAEIVSLTATLQTPAGRFTGCLRTRETTPLEPGEVEFKWYAPGIGLIKDGVLRLINIVRPGDNTADEE
jgi:hypothetical protein